MKQSKTFILLAVVSAVLILGVAYAAITSVTLNVNGNVIASPEQGNFKVAFSGVPTIKEGTKGTASVAKVSDTLATMYVSGLEAKDEAITVVFPIANTSEDIDATLIATTSNTNPDYFEVTTNLASSTPIAAKTGTVNLEVTVTLIKNPIDKDVTADIGVAITASPVV